MPPESTDFVLADGTQISGGDKELYFMSLPLLPRKCMYSLLSPDDVVFAFMEVVEVIGYIFGRNVYGTTPRRRMGMRACLGVSMLLVMELSEAACIFVVQFWVFVS